jgi:2-polyprenyl-6-methoxyphenol hydroxylase-like FAD-dependent oxidoreductase
MAPELDVCIRGAGIVGRTLALLLARDGLRVGLAGAPAATPHEGGDIRAYALNAASRGLLEPLRAWPDAAHATPVQAMQVHGDEGGEIGFQAAPGQPLAWIVDVPALLHQLGEALRYQPQVSWLDAPQPAPLTVVCEGKASATRAEFGVEFDLTSYAQQAIATRITCEKPHGFIARQWFCEGEILAFLPLGGDGPPGGGNSLAVVWSVREDRSAGLMALPSAQFAAGLEAASRGALGKVTAPGPRAAWPLHLARAGRWSGPGWVLAGDAAHTVHPLAGQGLNLGLADAAQLARVLKGREYWRGLGDARLLRRYARARQVDVLAMGTATDGLQMLFAQSGEPWSWLRNRGMWGFDRSGPVKQWVARQAMGLP